jgi:outer membrane protein insertion porin family
MGFSLEFTLPYSAFSNKKYKDPDELEPEEAAEQEDEKFKWVEFYKIKFNTGWYFELADKLVLSTRMQFGYLGHYNKEIGTTPFGRFYVGGDGLNNAYNMDGREIIAMRGYDNEVLPPPPTTVTGEEKDWGGTVYSKYTLELRYPLSLNPSSTIYVLSYLEAGNAWRDLKEYDPFDVYRTAGVGVRIFMPMFGFLGLDWGYGFDDIPGQPDANGAHFHFSMNKSID